MKRQLAKNTAVNYIKTAVVYAIRLVMVPLLLRELGTSAYGLFVLAASIFAPTDILQSGIGVSVAKHVAEYRARQDDEGLSRLVSTSFWVLSGVGAVVALVLVVFGYFFFTRVFNVPADSVSVARAYVLLSVVPFVISIPASLLVRVLEGIQRYDLLAATEIVTEVLRLALSALVLAAGLGLLGLAGVSTTCMLFVLVATAYFVRRHVPQLRIRMRGLTRTETTSVVSFSSRAFAVKVSTFLGDRLNPWLIGAFLPVAAVTPYSIAGQFHNVARLVPALAGSATMPVASELHVLEDEGRLAGLFVRMSKLTAVISLPFILAGIVLAKPLINGWLGPGFESSVPLAQLYLSYLILYLQVLAVMGLMLGTERFTRVLKAIYMATAVNIAVSILAIQYIGVAGVIVGSIVGNLIVWAAYMRVAYCDFSVDWPRYRGQVLLRAYGVAIPVYALLWWASTKVPPSNLAITVMYGALAALAYWGTVVLAGLDPGEKADLAVALEAVRGRLRRG